jgi:hypothetical protein
MVKPYRYMVNWHNQEVEEDDDGDLVEWIDYQELAERCERLDARIAQLVSALDQAAYDLSAAGQALAEFEGFEFRMNEATKKAYAASQRAHDANGYKEYP